MAEHRSDDPSGTRQRIAYLDACVLDEARRLTLGPKAAFLLGEDDRSVMWANAEGVRLLGARTVRPLVEGEVFPAQAIMRQVLPAVEDALEAGGNARGMLRTRTDFRTRLLEFEARVLDLGVGERAVLVVTDDIGGGDLQRHAQQACDTLDGYGHASAIVDADGDIVARSPGFDALRIDDATLNRLVAEVRDEADRLVKRPIRVAGGEERRAAGIARLLDEPALHILIVASRSETSEEDATPPLAALATVRDEHEETAEDGASDEVAAAAQPPRRWYYRSNTAGAAPAKGEASDERVDEPDGHEVPRQAEQTEEPFGPTDEQMYEADLEDLSALDEANGENVWAAPEETAEAPPIGSEDRGNEEPISFTEMADAIDAEESEDGEALQSQSDAMPFAAEDADPAPEDPPSPTRQIGFGIAASAAAVGGGLVRTVEHSDIDGTADKPIGDETAEALALNEAEGGVAANGDISTGDPFEGIAPDETDALDHAGDAGTDDAFVFERRPKATRFVWSLDADKRFRSVSGDLAEAVGPRYARLEGRAWSDVAQEFGFDEDGAIDDLLSQGDTWSGRKVLWPVQGEALRVPVDLAGLPAFGRERQFEGFNGFGIVHTDEAAPAADEPSDPADDAGPAAFDEGDFGEEEPMTEVVDLEAHRREESGLSSDERRAFERIGQRLAPNDVDAPKPAANDDTRHAEAAGDGPVDADPPEREPDVTEDEPDAEPDEGADDETWRVAVIEEVDTSILERLPVPVVAYRGHDLLFANEPFMTLTGFENLEALAEEGGIDRLFGRADDREGAPIQHRDGHTLSVQAHLQSVPWDASRATLLTLRNPPRDHGSDGEPETGPANGATTSRERRTPDTGPARASDGHEPSADELRSILDTAADGVLLLDREGAIQGMNRSAEALFDVESGEMVGTSVTNLLAPESHRSALDYIGGLSGTGVASILNDGRELIGRTRSGGLVPLFVTIGAISDGERLCAVMRDMTHWKRTEEDLIAARAEAQRESESKTRFLAHMSHELRTPLNAIIGFSEMMIGEQFGPLGNDRYLRYCQDIRRSGEHVLDIVNDLLDISKIESGSMDLDFDAISLNTVVTETAAMMQGEANGERVVIRTSLDADLPQIVADARSMRQILINLVANAIQFTQAGGQVIVSTSYDAGDVTMRVRDTGIGMTASQMEKALLPFQQVQRDQTAPGERRRGRKGTGLGLPLTKALAEANRARFRIESEPHEGTLVELRFPAQRVLAH